MKIQNQLKIKKYFNICNDYFNRNFIKIELKIIKMNENLNS